MSARPTYAMTYVAYWPHANVLKVGRAWRSSRLAMLRMSGARIILCMRNTDGSWERWALRRLRRWFPQAFQNWREAEDLLFRGRGWTECFTVSEYHLQLAVELCIEGFARGNEQGVNTNVAAENHQRRGSTVRRLPARTARSEGDSPRPMAQDRPRRQKTPGHLRDRSGAVSGGRPSGRGDSDRAAHPDARGVGIPRHVHRRRTGMAGSASPAAWRPPRAGSDVTRTPSGGLPGALAAFHGIRGCGERARVGARESAGEGAMGGGSRRTAMGRVESASSDPDTPPSGTSSAALGSSAGVCGSSGRYSGALWTMRHRPEVSREMVGAGALRGSVGRVRRGQQRGSIAR